MHVFVVIATGISEHSIITEVRGVFAHRHQCDGLVRRIRDDERKLVVVEKHWVMDATPGIPGTGWLPGGAPVGEGGQTDPTAMAVRPNPGRLNHVSSCVLYCADPDNEEQECRHMCWCREGGLSFDEFKGRHPEWGEMLAETWLAAPEGQAWLVDMSQTK